MMITEKLLTVDCEKFEKIATVNTELLITAIKKCIESRGDYPFVPRKFKKSFKGCLLTIEASNGETLDLSCVVSNYTYDKYSGKDDVDIRNYPSLIHEPTQKYSVPYKEKFEKIVTQPYFLLKILKGIPAKELDIFIMRNKGNGCDYYAFKGQLIQTPWSAYYVSVNFIQSSKGNYYDRL